MSVKSWEKIRLWPLASHIPIRAVNKPAGPSLCLSDHKQRGRRGRGTFQILKQKSTSSHVDGSMGGGKEGGGCSHCRVSVRYLRDDTINLEKEIYLKEALSFQLASCLLQTLTRRPWKCFGFMDGKFSFCLSVFTASDKNTPIKTKHPYSFGKC